MFYLHLINALMIYKSLFEYFSVKFINCWLMVLGQFWWIVSLCFLYIFWEREAKLNEIMKYHMLFYLLIDLNCFVYTQRKGSNQAMWNEISCIGVFIHWFFFPQSTFLTFSTCNTYVTNTDIYSLQHNGK